MTVEGVVYLMAAYYVFNVEPATSFLSRLNNGQGYIIYTVKGRSVATLYYVQVYMYRSVTLFSFQQTF